METILNYALNNAIKQCDINMVQLCLENAVLITNESIEIQQFAETVKNLENHDEVGSMLLYESSIVHPHNDNYKILLNNGFDIYICPTLIKLLNLQHTSRFYIRDQIKRLLDFGINIYNYQPEILNFYRNYIEWVYSNKPVKWIENKIKDDEHIMKQAFSQAEILELHVPDKINPAEVMKLIE